MGFSIKFNWVLQIDVSDALKIDSTYAFRKTGNRVFPIGTPIDLIDLKRNAIAKIRVTSFSNELDVTTGFYKVVKIYADDEKAILTNYWVENE